MAEPQPPNVAPPREPEIEFLAKVVRGALLTLRYVSIVAGTFAIAWGIASIAGWRPGDGAEADASPAPVPDYEMLPTGEAPPAAFVVWLCAGIPLVLPIAFTFGRGRWPLLVLGALLWFGPIALEGDHAGGWVIRVFASFVACSVLFVWKTLWELTQRAGAPAAAG